MKLTKIAAAALVAAGLITAAAAAPVAWAQDAPVITTPYDPTFAVDPAKLANVCAGGSNERLHLKFGATVLAAPRGAVASFTPLRVGVVKDNDVPINLAFKADAGCAENPIEVAHAEMRVEGRAEQLMLATSTVTGGLSGAAKSVIYLRDEGKCPHEGKFTVCKGSQDVNGQKVDTYAFIGDLAMGATPSGEPYFALCEGSRSQAACEVSDEVAPGLSFRMKLPKGQPKVEDIRALHASVRALLATMKP